MGDSSSQELKQSRNLDVISTVKGLVSIGVILCQILKMCNFERRCVKFEFFVKLFVVILNTNFCDWSNLPRWAGFLVFRIIPIFSTERSTERLQLFVVLSSYSFLWMNTIPPNESNFLTFSSIPLHNSSFVHLLSQFEKRKKNSKKNLLIQKWRKHV